MNEIRNNPTTSTFLSVVDITLKSFHKEIMLLRMESTWRYIHCKQVRHARIRIRVGPPHPLGCCKRRLNEDLWGSGWKLTLRIPLCVVRSDWMGRSFRWDRKTEAPCHSRCDTINIPPCSKALSIGLNFAALNRQWWHTSPYKWNIFEWDVRL
jgi:hypothetical protein